MKKEKIFTRKKYIVCTVPYAIFLLIALFLYLTGELSSAFGWFAFGTGAYSIIIVCVLINDIVDYFKQESDYKSYLKSLDD